MEEKKKRARYRSPERQLALALNQAEQMTEGNSSISQRRLVAERLRTLTILTARRRSDALKETQAALAAAQAEIERLKAELAARPVPAPATAASRPKPIDNVTEVLQQVAKEERDNECTRSD